MKALYRDRDLIALEKQDGMDSYQSSGASELHPVLGLKEAYEEKMGERLFPVHRLDQATSGLILFALNPKAASLMQRLFREGKVKKIYRAWVMGHPPDRGIIQTPLKVKGSTRTERAKTTYKKIKSKGQFSLLECYPETGRFHQIRRHLQSIGHPILGDLKYGHQTELQPFPFNQGQSRLMLHALEMSFIHPIQRRELKIQTKGSIIKDFK